MGKGLAAASAAAALVAAAAAVALAHFRKQRKPSKYDELQQVVLKNKEGVEVHITPVGASIQRMIIPVQGKKVDIVLGYNKPSTYALIENTPYFGAIVGRCANRIANGKFTVNGQDFFQLAANNGPNALHGGPNGFHRRTWEVASETETEESSTAVLHYTSQDGEEGYPGKLQVTVVYELLAHAAELRTTITATTDKATPVNIAAHSYFNLAGHNSGTILSHSVKLAADHYTPVGDTQVPTGQILPVAGTPFDFVTPHTVGERMEQVPGGYDHNYVLFGMGPQARFITRNQAVSSTPRLAATVVEPSSGLMLEVLTSAPGMQFYTGGFLGEAMSDAKDGAHYPRFAGLCLETQNFPDAINQPAFPSVVLHPGETYKHQIVYRLTTSSS